MSHIQVSFLATASGALSAAGSLGQDAPTMSEILSHERFEKCHDQIFAATDGDSQLDLRLIRVEAKEGASPPPGSRVPFSLLFRGPLEPVLPQHLYSLANDHIGIVEIFIVPIGPDDEGMRYEAVFS